MLTLIAIPTAIMVRIGYTVNPAIQFARWSVWVGDHRTLSGEMSGRAVLDLINVTTI